MEIKGEKPSVVTTLIFHRFQHGNEPPAEHTTADEGVNGLDKQRLAFRRRLYE